MAQGCGQSGLLEANRGFAGIRGWLDAGEEVRGLESQLIAKDQQMEVLVKQEAEQEP